MIVVRTLPALCSDRSTALAAARASADLMERFGVRFNLDRWDHRAVAAFVGGTAVGFLQFKKDENLPEINVSLAWCSPAWPRALAALALALRSLALSEGVQEITFTHHHGNDAMARLVGIIGARAESHSFLLDLTARAPNRNETS